MLVLCPLQERNSLSVFPVNDLVGDRTQKVRQVVNIAAVFSGTSVDGDTSSEGMSTVHLGTVSHCPAATEKLASRAALGFKSGHTEPFRGRHAGPIWLQGAPEGTSVDQEASLISDTESSQVNLNRSPTLQLEQMIGQTVYFNPKREAHDGDDNDESSGYEDAPSEFLPTPSTPDVQPDGDLLEGDGNAGGTESDSSRNLDSCALS